MSRKNGTTNELACSLTKGLPQHRTTATVSKTGLEFSALGSTMFQNAAATKKQISYLYLHPRRRSRPPQVVHRNNTNECERYDLQGVEDRARSRCSRYHLGEHSRLWLTKAKIDEQILCVLTSCGWPPS